MCENISIENSWVVKIKKSKFAIPLMNKIFVLIIQALIKQGLPSRSFRTQQSSKGDLLNPSMIN